MLLSQNTNGLTAVQRAVQLLFAGSKQGVHFEAYNPDDLLKRRNFVLWSANFNKAEWNLSAGNYTATDSGIPSPVAGINYQTVTAATTGNTNVSLSCFSAGCSSGNSFSLYVKRGNTPASSFVLRNETTSTNITAGSINWALGVWNMGASVGSATATLTPVQGKADEYLLTLANAAPAIRNGDTLRVYIGFTGGTATAGDFLYATAVQVNKELSRGDYQHVTDWTTEYLGGTPVVRRNLFLWSEDLSKSSWTKTNASIGNGNKVVESTANGYHSCSQATSVVGSTNTLWLRVKAAERSDVWLQQGTKGAYFNLATASVTVVSANQTATIAAAPDAPGFYDLTVTSIADTATSSFGIAQGGQTGSYAGDGTSGVIVAFVQNVAESGKGAYQKVTDWTTEVAADEQSRRAVWSRIGMWQDAVGTTPVTAVEQPVGLWLDTKQELARGQELVTNGGFNVDASGWTPGVGSTLSVESGRLKIVGAQQPSYQTQTLTLTPGFYEISYEAEINDSSAATDAIRVGLGGAYNGPTNINPAHGRATRREIFSPTSTGALTLQIIVYGAADTVAYIDNISVRRLPGNHATQATSASRPTLSARYNLLQKTEQLSTWTATNAGTGVAPIVTDNYATAPDGTMTATRVQLNAGAGNTSADISWIATTAGSAAIGAGLGRGRVFMRTTDGSAKTVIYRPCTGTRNQVALTGVWQEVTFTGGDTQNFQILTYGDIGDDVADILVWHPDFRTNDDAAKNIPAYQRVNTATDYDTEGFPHYLKFDGVDDGLQTGNIDFTAYDKIAMFAGLTKLSDAAVGVVVELSANLNMNSGSFYLAAPVQAGQTNYNFTNSGTSQQFVNITNASVAAPNTSIITGLGDISGDSVILRMNGASGGSNTADQGSGNYGNYPIYIGKRSSGLPANIRLYVVSVCALPGFPLSEAVIRRSEKYVAALTEKVLG